MAAPLTPTGLAVDQTWSNMVQLSWNASIGATSYNVYRSIDDITYIKIETVTGLSHLDEFVEDNTTYHYKVSAENVDGESSLSSKVSGLTLSVVLKQSRIAGGKEFYEHDQNAYFEANPTNVVPGFSGDGFIRSNSAPLLDEDVVRKVDSGSIYAPPNASYIVVALDGTLSAERRLQVGTGLLLTDGGANGNLTIGLVLGSIDHDSLQNFLANEHIDWTAASATALNCGEAQISGDLNHDGNNVGFFSVAPAVRQSHIVDADGTLADITTKFNNLLAALETYGLLKTV